MYFEMKYINSNSKSNQSICLRHVFCCSNVNSSNFALSFFTFHSFQYFVMKRRDNLKEEVFAYKMYLSKDSKTLSLAHRGPIMNHNNPKQVISKVHFLGNDKEHFNKEAVMHIVGNFLKNFSWTFQILAKTKH